MSEAPEMTLDDVVTAYTLLFGRPCMGRQWSNDQYEFIARSGVLLRYGVDAQYPTTSYTWAKMIEHVALEDMAAQKT